MVTDYERQTVVCRGGAATRWKTPHQQPVGMGLAQLFQLGAVGETTTTHSRWHSIGRGIGLSGCNSLQLCSNRRSVSGWCEFVQEWGRATRKKRQTRFRLRREGNKTAHSKRPKRERHTQGAAGQCAWSAVLQVATVHASHALWPTICQPQASHRSGPTERDTCCFSFGHLLPTTTTGHCLSHLLGGINHHQGIMQAQQQSNEWAALPAERAS